MSIVLRQWTKENVMLMPLKKEKGKMSNQRREKDAKRTIDAEKRKSTILLLNIILNALLKWFAPILSFTTEEIFKLLFKDQKSIHLKKFIEFPAKFKNQELSEKWSELIKIRNICNISIEEKRASKEIGSSLEANLKIQLSRKLKKQQLKKKFYL